MATIPGSHYVATAPGQPVNVVETTTGMDLPPTVPGSFNLEVFIGSVAGVTNIAPGYQGLAVLGPSGLELDLISGAFAVTDQGSGNDTLDAFGADETIGGGAGVTLNLLGASEAAQGGSGADTINALGSFETVDGGSGGNLINLIGSSSWITQGTGSDTINIIGNADTVTAGAEAGANQGVVNLLGTNMTVADGGNKFTDTVVGFDQAAGDRIHLTTDTVANTVAHSTQVNGGADTLISLSDGSTILLKGVTHIHSSFFS